MYIHLCVGIFASEHEHGALFTFFNVTRYVYYVLSFIKVTYYILYIYYTDIYIHKIYVYIKWCYDDANKASKCNYVVGES